MLRGFLTKANLYLSRHGHCDKSGCGFQPTWNSSYSKPASLMASFTQVPPVFGTCRKQEFFKIIIVRCSHAVRRRVTSSPSAHALWKQKTRPFLPAPAIAGQVCLSVSWSVPGNRWIRRRTSGRHRPRQPLDNMRVSGVFLRCSFLCEPGPDVLPKRAGICAIVSCGGDYATLARKFVKDLLNLVGAMDKLNPWLSPSPWLSARSR